MEEETSWYIDQIPEDCKGYDGNEYWDDTFEYECDFPEIDCKEEKCVFRRGCFHPKTWEGLEKEEW
jgi:hypothetical protein